MTPKHTRQEYEWKRVRTPSPYAGRVAADPALKTQPHFKGWTPEQVNEWIEEGLKSDKLNDHEMDHYRGMMRRSVYLMQITENPVTFGPVPNVLTPFLARFVVGVMNASNSDIRIVPPRKRKGAKFGGGFDCICGDCTAEIGKTIHQ